MSKSLQVLAVMHRTTYSRNCNRDSSSRWSCRMLRSSRHALRLARGTLIRA